MSNSTVSSIFAPESYTVGNITIDSSGTMATSIPMTTASGVFTMTGSSSGDTIYINQPKLTPSETFMYMSLITELAAWIGRAPKSEEDKRLLQHLKKKVVDLLD